MNLEQRRTMAGKELSTKQFIYMIYKTELGVGVLSLPGEVSGEAGAGGWMSILIGWIITLVAGWFIVKVLERYPGRTLLDILHLILGKWLGKAAASIVVLYALYAVTTVSFSIIFIYQNWILPNTPNYILMLLVMLPVYAVAQYQIRVLGRFAEFVFLFTLWMPPLLLFALKDSHWLNLLPLLPQGWSGVLRAVKYTIFPFLGFEIAFLYVPYLENRREAFKGLFFGTTIYMVLLVFVFLFCTIYFGPEEITTYSWPTLNLLKTITLPIIERFEIVFLSFYLIIMAQTIIPYMHMASLGARDVIGMKRHIAPLRFLVGLLLVLAVVFEPSFEQITLMQQYWGWLGVGFSYAMPVLFFAIVVLVGRWRRKS
ncbi:GerAB/ArcD/ProY family transporter [Paenibacillus flagellatus]|uniref:Spore gernimation protein n=1 Tax=Paenibacillus flagellatus TaxID=2211139 RepID=A0A2V5KBJ1_9BACL|nr:endospore germination permease [Paenibacillus flagellatus]PYI56915.1 spore gernimation protein [Paenibacillus flagellatus]